MEKAKYLIVGAGSAGINAIRTLREVDPTGSVVLVAAEVPYSRMVLPYYLEKTITEARVFTVSEESLAQWNVTCHFGRFAERLDGANKTLHLSGDLAIAYENLLIATGSSAQRPPVAGADNPALSTFWTLADAKGLHHNLGAEDRVAVVGAGFITFTIFDALFQRAKKLTIIEAAPRILPRMLDAQAAEIIEAWLKKRGVEVLTGAQLNSIESQGSAHRLTLASGVVVEAERVVMATGIRPNSDWLTDSGIALDQGILVDEAMATNLPGVYAAGDVAQGKNLIGGKQEVHAIEPTAMDQGRVAGTNMAGRGVRYQGSLLMNIISLDGLDASSFGAWDAEGETIVGSAPNRSSYRKYIFEGERIVGAIVVAPKAETWSQNELGMIKGLIQSGTPLGEWKAHLKAHPFSIKKAYLACNTVANLLPKTILGSPSASPRL